MWAYDVTHMPYASKMWAALCIHITLLESALLHTLYTFVAPDGLWVFAAVCVLHAFTTILATYIGFYLRHQYKELRNKSTLLDMSPIAMCIIRGKLIKYTNSQFQSLYQLTWSKDDSPESYTLKAKTHMQDWYRDDWQLYQRAVADAEALQDGCFTESCNLTLHRPDHTTRRVQLQSHKFEGSLYACVVDVTDMHQAMQQEKSLMQSVARQKEEILARQKYENMCRAADNHILHNCKNIFIGVRDNVTHEMPDCGTKDVIVAALKQGIETCHDREFFNLVEQAAYTPRQAKINVRHFVAKIGRLYAIDVDAACEGYVYIDDKVAQYVIRDAVVNAKQHGAGDVKCSALRDHQRLLFIVTNSVSKDNTEMHNSKIGLLHANKCAAAAQCSVEFEIKNRLAKFVFSAPYLPINPPPSTALQRCAHPLSVAIVDDAHLIRMSSQRALRKLLSPNKLLVLGASQKEIRDFPHTAMGFAIAIVDFNLEMNNFNGENILIEMRLNGFDGPIVVRSANDTAHDRREYMAMGFDACISKSDDIAHALRLLLPNHKELFDV